MMPVLALLLSASAGFRIMNPGTDDSPSASLIEQEIQQQLSTVANQSEDLTATAEAVCCMCQRKAEKRLPHKSYGQEAKAVCQRECPNACTTEDDKPYTLASDWLSNAEGCYTTAELENIWHLHEAVPLGSYRHLCDKRPRPPDFGTIGQGRLSKQAKTEQNADAKSERDSGYSADSLDVE